MSPLAPEESGEEIGKKTIHLNHEYLQNLIKTAQDPASTPEDILSAQKAVSDARILSGTETIRLTVEEILERSNAGKHKALPVETEKPDVLLPRIEEIQAQLDSELPSRRAMYNQKPFEEEILQDPRTTDNFFLTPRHKVPLKVYYWYEGVNFRIVHDTIAPFQKPHVKGKLPKHEMVTKIGNLLPAFYHAFEKNNFGSKHPFSFETILKSLRWKFEKPKLYIPARISHMIGVLGSDEEFIAFTEKELRTGPGGEAYKGIDSDIIQTEIAQILRDIHKQDFGEDIFSINGEIGLPIDKIYYVVHEAFSVFINKHWNNNTDYHFFNLNALFHQEGVGEQENATARAFLQDDETWDIVSKKLQEFLPKSSTMQSAMLLGIRCMLEGFITYNEKAFLHPLDADPKKHLSPVGGTIESRAAFALDEFDISEEEEESDTDEELIQSKRYNIFPDGYGKIYESLDINLYGKHPVSLSIPGTRSSIRIPGKSAQTNILPPLHMHGHHFVYKDNDGTGFVFDNLKTSIQKFKKIGTVEEIRRDDGSIADVVFTVYDGDLESIYSLEKQGYIL